MAGQGAVARLSPVAEARRMGAERPRGMGADGARRRGADGARRRGADGTGGGVSDGLGLGENMAVVVQFERAGGPGGQLGRFEGIHQVHLHEDRRRRDEIQRLLSREHFGRVQIGQLRSGQMIHDAGAERVAHHVDGGTHSVAEWTNSLHFTNPSRFHCPDPNMKHRQRTHSSQSTAISRLMS